MKSVIGRTKLYQRIGAFLTLCLMALQFTPFWKFNGQSLSINKYVWLDCSNSEIESWFAAQLGSSPGINSFVITAVLVLVLGVAGIILYLVKPNSGLGAVCSAASALSAIYAFAFKPAFRLGETWVLQLILSVVIVAVAAALLVLWHKSRNAADSKSESQATDVAARVAYIRSLAAKEEMHNSKKHKDKGDDSNNSFNLLLTYLSDELPECRIAACEALGQSTRDVAFTHISYMLLHEKDESVKNAMKAALVHIRNNEEQIHTKQP